jgi:integrase
LKTYGAAEVALTRLQGQVENRHPKTDITLGQAISRWLEIAKLEDTTRDRYEDLVRMYVGPVLGDLAAGKLDAELLESFYARLQRCRDLCDGRVARVMCAGRSVAAPSERFTTSSAPHWSRPSDGVTSG